ncbi:MAG: hypothetical protein H0Z35_09005 [Thermoanaerobacteraceae bacterium]|nr:hypothetical protein [Thermoanaerobacteraceae bacterium]
MPKSYLICAVEKFYDDEFYQMPIQEALFEHEGEAVINYKLTRKDFYQGYDQYTCHHDYKHKKYGKVFNQFFTYYFEPVDFYMYYNRNKSILLIQTKTDIARDYIRILNSSKAFDCQPVPIDFAKMYPLITEVSGAWIADLKRTYLKTAGLFGPNVNKSEEFKIAAEEGEVSSLQLQYVSKLTKEEHTIAISKKSSIVLYDTFDMIEDELDLVLDVYETLINIGQSNGENAK